MSFLQEYAKHRKEEDRLLEIAKAAGVKRITEHLYFLIRDIAREKFKPVEPTVSQIAVTECEFMIWLGNSYRKSAKIKRSK